MTIEQALSNIRSAVYGNEVKQSIIEGLQLCYTERASSGYDPVDDLNQFYCGSSIISGNAENRPFDGPFFLIAGGNESICCQLAIDPSGTNSNKLRKKENEVWSPWGSIAISRTLRYWNYNGTELLHTETVIDGTNGIWNGTPSRPPSEQYNYVFLGWNTSPNQSVAQDNATKNVMSDRDVYAAYSTTTQDYTVTFINVSSIVDTVSVAYGGTAVYTGMTPARTSTSQYDYVFAGWNTSSSALEPDVNALVNVTGNRVVYAIYTPIIRSYTVRFFNGSTLLQSVSVQYGSNAEYTDNDPTKQSDGNYDYSFVGWNTNPNAESADSGALYNITGNKDVYAVYISSPHVYTVRFINGTNVLQAVNVPYGGNVTYVGATPTKAQTAQYTYSFIGWSTYSGATSVDPNATINIVSDRDVYAVFSYAIRYYTVRFINVGNVVQTLSVAYGDSAVYSGAEPIRDADAQYSYTFIGWNTNPNAATRDVNYGTDIRGNRDIYAIYSLSVRLYTVRFMSGITVLQAVNDIPYGGTATYTGAIPEHPSEPEEYIFAGFNPDGSNITGNTDCYVVWTDAGVAKHIRYWNYDGSELLYTEAVVSGEDGIWSGAPARTSTEQYDFTFLGWNETMGALSADEDAQKNVTSTRDLYAVYSSSIRSYTVRFYNRSTLVQSKTVQYGNDTSYTGNTPTRDSTPEYRYEFLGWNENPYASTADANAMKNIVSNRDLFAVFVQIANVYTVRFMNGSTVLQTVTNIAYGGMAVYTGSVPVHPTEPQQYEFGGFYPDGTNIQNDTDCYPIWINVEETNYTREIVSRTISGSYYNDLVQFVGEHAFDDCEDLESVEFPIVKTVGDYAFKDCSSLSRAEFPTVTRINDYAFSGCTSLTTLIVGTDSQVVCELGSNVFNGANSSMNIYVPDSLVSSYQEAPRWIAYSSKIHGISELPGV